MTKLSLALTTVLLILSSCNGLIKRESTTKNKENVAEENSTKSLPLEGHSWIIEQFNTPGFTVENKNCSLLVSKDKTSFSANDGCNVISGMIMLKGNQIAFNKTEITEKACFEGVEQAALFASNMKKVDNFKIVGGELFLYKGTVLIMTLEDFR